MDKAYVKESDCGGSQIRFTFSRRLDIKELRDSLENRLKRNILNDDCYNYFTKDPRKIGATVTVFSEPKRKRGPGYVLNPQVKPVENEDFKEVSFEEHVPILLVMEETETVSDAGNYGPPWRRRPVYYVKKEITKCEVIWESSHESYLASVVTYAPMSFNKTKIEG